MKTELILAQSQILAQVGGDISPQEIPGAGEKANAAMSYFMWGCVIFAILGVMGCAVAVIVARRRGEMDEVQGTVMRVLFGCIILGVAGPVVNALVA